MAKTKTPKAPEPKVLDEALHDEIAGLLKARNKIVVVEGEEVAIPDEASLDMAVNVLTLSRALIRNTKAAAADKIEKTIPADVAKTLTSIDKEKKSIVKQAEAIESDVETGLYGMIARGLITSEGYTSQTTGAKLALIGKVGVHIDDGATFPDEFYLPRALDLTKVREALEAEQRKAAAAKELGLPATASALPGAQLTTLFTFRTTQPDVIEE